MFPNESYIYTESVAGSPEKMCSRMTTPAKRSPGAEKPTFVRLRIDILSIEEITLTRKIIRMSLYPVKFLEKVC